jgi:hypothetical protein
MEFNRKLKLNGLVDSSQVIVKHSLIDKKGLGVFSAIELQKGKVIERGIARIIDCDGHKCPYVFTWSHNKETPSWAIGSGASTFYNHSSTPNVHMFRNYINNTFEILALCDIKKDEELCHCYKSINYRKCFLDIK